MDSYNFRMWGTLLPTVVLVLILFAELIKGGYADTGTDSENGGKNRPILPTGLRGWWGENDIQRDVVAVRGSSVLLPCQIPDLESLLEFTNVTWLKNNETLQNRRSFITSEGNLNITKLMRRRRTRPIAPEVDDGEYRCVVSVLNGGIPWVVSSTPIFLHVADIGRQVNVSPANVSLFQGEALRLSCQINSQPAARYIWVKIGGGRGSHLQGDRINNSNSGVLQISNVEKSHAGSYRCIATNLLMNKTRESSVVRVSIVSDGVKIPEFVSPTFLFPTSNHSMSVVEGRGTTLECLATGIPPPTITWQRKIASNEKVFDEEMPDEGYTFLGAGNLHLRKTAAHHAGTYICRATSRNPVSGISYVVTKETTLEVLRPPTIVNSLRNVTTLVAKTVRLNCSLLAGHRRTSPRISWYKNGQPIVTDTRIEIRDENQLVFVNSISKDTGVYQCMVENEAGFATSWSYLLVNSSQDHPYPPQNLKYILLSPTSAILSWDAVHSTSSPLLAYSVHYTKLDPKPIEFQEVPTNNSLLLDSLIPHTNYSFQVRAYTTHASDLSEKVYFITKEDVPSEVPAFSLKALSPRTLLVTWDPVSPGKSRGTITTYKVVWQRRSKHYYNLDEVNAPLLRHNVTGLHPGKTYKVRVLARTSAGYNEAVDWPWKLITMPEVNKEMRRKLPKAPIMKTQVSGDSKFKNITVSWNRPSDDKAKITGYVLKYKRRDNSWSKDINLSPSTSSYIIQNLESDWYRVKLRGFNDEGNGSPAVEVIDTQSSNAVVSSSHLPTVIQIKVSVVSQTIVSLSWAVKKADDQRIAFYTICQREVDAYGEDRPIYRRSTRNTISIDGLIPFSEYEFIIRAHISERIYGPYSAPVTTSPMLDNAPVTPNKVVFEAVDASTIELKWDVLNVPDGPTTKYQVIYSLNNTLPLANWNKEEIDGESLVYKISGLVSNTDYWFRVRGCTELSCGSFSEPLVASIPAILPPHQSSSFQLYLIIGLVGTIALLLIVSFLALYILKFRQSFSPQLSLSCNGNGTRGCQNPHGGRNGTVSDSNGTNPDSIPMLIKTHNDLPDCTLDTKGGYQSSRVNGFTNQRCNGFVRDKDVHYRTSANADKALDCEESKQLFLHSSVPKMSEEDPNTQMTPQRNAPLHNPTCNT